jgi:hypothetical protein
LPSSSMASLTRTTFSNKEMALAFSSSYRIQSEMWLISKRKESYMFHWWCYLIQQSSLLLKLITPYLEYRATLAGKCRHSQSTKSKNYCMIFSFIFMQDVTCLNHYNQIGTHVSSTSVFVNRRSQKIAVCSYSAMIQCYSVVIAAIR